MAYKILIISLIILINVIVALIAWIFFKVDPEILIISQSTATGFLAVLFLNSLKKGKKQDKISA